MKAQEVKGWRYRDDWLYELKKQGARCIAILDGGTELYSSSGNNITFKFPELQELHKQARHPCILDGEITSVGAKDCKNRIHKEKLLDIRIASKNFPANYHVFDILTLKGIPTLKNPQMERKEMLSSSFIDDEHAQILPFQIGDGEALFKASAEDEQEGIMAKSPTAIYVPGWRGNSWIKLKNFQWGSFYILGLTAGENAREGSFGSLMLGEMRGDTLVYVGNVGTGFNERQLGDVLQLMRDAKVDAAPARADPGKPVLFWTKPIYKARIRYLEYGSEGKLSIPSFRGIDGAEAEQERTKHGSTQSLM